MKKSSGKILAQLRYPLVFYGLALLIIEASLSITVVTNISEQTRIAIIILMVVSFLIIIMIVSFLVYRVPSHIMLESQKDLPTKNPIRLSEFHPVEQFEIARKLYIAGSYYIAKELFEREINSGDTIAPWRDSNRQVYFYHYLKTLHALGEHKRALVIAKEIRQENLPLEMTAAIEAANGLGNWKLGNFISAKKSLVIATEIYSELSKRDSMQILNEADARVLYLITSLEEARISNNIKLSSVVSDLYEQTLVVDKLYNKYQALVSQKTKSHYLGRYFGLRAFLSLLNLDSMQTEIKDASQWNEAIEFSIKAFGGVSKAGNRNPFGELCGKYCAAATCFHKYENCSDENEKNRALHESGEFIKDVLDAYGRLFGFNRKIFRLWAKIYRLCSLLCDVLPPDLKKSFEKYCHDENLSNRIEIYVPLH